MNKIFKQCLIFACIASVPVLAAASACTAKPVEKSGILEANAVEGAQATQYVMCVSKEVADAQLLLDTVNEVLDEIDVEDIAQKYCDYQNRRGYQTLENYMYNLNDNTGEPIIVYTSTFEPFNYSGAGGAYTDGIDAYIMLHVAEKLDRQIKFFDYDYSYSYSETKAGNADFFVGGIALTDALKQDFLVSDVYLAGSQKIVCDKNEHFTKIEQLKGLRIGVVSGREGAVLVKDEINNGSLKGTGASIMEYSTDTEAESMLHQQMCDVLVLDDFPAVLIAEKANDGE